MPISRFAVPLFFVISGYFLVDAKMHIKGSLYVQKQIIKIGKLILSSSFVYAIYNLFLGVIVFAKDFDFNLCFRPISRDNFIISLLFGNIFSDPLWYLTSYLQILILIPVFRVLSSKKILLIIVISYLGGVFVGNYLWFWEDIDLPLPLVRNVFTMAIPFVLLGILIRKEQKLFFSVYQKYSKLFFFFIILDYMEYGFIGMFGFIKRGDYVLTTILLVVFIFMFALKHPNIGRNSCLQFIGQKLSLNIYIYHSLVASLVNLINNRFQIFPKGFSFLIVLGLTILFVFFMEKLNVWYKTIKEHYA